MLHPGSATEEPGIALGKGGMEPLGEFKTLEW